MSPPDNAAASTEDASRPQFNAGVHNIYGPGGSRPLTVVVEPQLHANDENMWYLAASTDQVDTVEMATLAGEESPVMESEWCMTDDTFKNKVRQTMGAAAIDWRGLLRNAGA
jgi:hypothetical protein